MKITQGPIPGIFIIEPQVFEDSRGYFFESFNKKKFDEATGIKSNFVQDNQSKSVRGVLRGLHFQLNPNAQSKLVRTLSGEVWDVAVDIRLGSPTYGEYFGIHLSSENKKQIFIPGGFAHGFVVLSETAEIHYKTDNFYHKESESGIIFNDPDINIDWPIADADIVLSEKDKELKPLKEAKNNFNNE